MRQPEQLLLYPFSSSYSSSYREIAANGKPAPITAFRKKTKQGEPGTTINRLPMQSTK